MFADYRIYSNKQFDFGVFLFMDPSTSSSSLLPGTAAVPGARKCLQVYKWTSCCAECGKIFLIIQITQHQLPKKQRDLRMIRGLNPFEVFSSSFFIWFLPLCYESSSSTVSALLLLNKPEIPATLGLIVFCGDSTNHHFHLALIKPFYWPETEAIMLSVLHGEWSRKWRIPYADLSQSLPPGKATQSHSTDIFIKPKHTLDLILMVFSLAR